MSKSFCKDKFVVEPTRERGLACVPWNPSQRRTGNYVPLTARPLCLITILVLILGCIAVLETAFRCGVKPVSEGRKTDFAKRQDYASTINDKTVLSSASSTIASTGTVTRVHSTTSTGVMFASSFRNVSWAAGTYEFSLTGPYITLDTTAVLSPGETVVLSSIASDTSIALKTGKPAEQVRATFKVSSAVAASDEHSTLSTTEPGGAGQMTGQAGQMTGQAEQTTAQATSYPSIAQGKTSATIFGTGVVTSPAGFLTALITQSLPHGLIVTHSMPTTSVSASSTSRPGTISTTEIQVGTTFTKFDYFAASYLAVLVVVALKSIWTMVFASMKMMEPFHQLSKPGGAEAKDSLLSDYLSTGHPQSHLRSIFSGRWAMLLTTAVHVCIAALAPLATESMAVTTTAFCKTASGVTMPCNAVWVMDATIARALQGVLSVIAILITALILLSWRRSSGVFSNPSTIASMAALLGHEEFLADLRQLDPSASASEISKTLSGNKYVLSSYEAAPGHHRYGITKKISLIKPSRTTSGISSRSSQLSNPPDKLFTSHLGQAPILSFSTRALREALFLFFILALLAVILAYYLDHADDAFNRFFNSQTFGPRFTLTCAAVVIDLHWKTLEREVRIMAPYRRLGKRNAKAANTVLKDMHGTPVGSLPLALWRGEWFHGMIAATAVLSDLLIIAVSGVPVGRAQVFQAFLASTYITMGILGVMILSVFGILWWRRDVEKLRMPREPDTLIAVLLMLCNDGNGVRKHFEGWEAVDGGRRERACREMKARYWGGWVQGKNAEWRWCVEKEKEKEFEEQNEGHR